MLFCLVALFALLLMEFDKAFKFLALPLGYEPIGFQTVIFFSEISKTGLHDLAIMFALAPLSPANISECKITCCNNI